MTSFYRTEMRETKVHDRTECDRCGALVPQPEGFGVRDFTLHHLTGDGFPEGGFTSGWAADLCDECIGWLKVTLEAGGVKLQQTEVEW